MKSNLIQNMTPNFEELFEGELETLSISSGEDESEFIIKSIDKMTSIIKGNRSWHNLYDGAEHEWNELMESTIITSDRLSEIQINVKEGREEVDAGFLKKSDVIDISRKLLIETALQRSTGEKLDVQRENFSRNANNHVDMQARYVEDPTEKVIRRKEVKELLDVMIESVECSQQIFHIDRPFERPLSAFPPIPFPPISPGYFDQEDFHIELQSPATTRGDVTSFASTLTTRPSEIESTIPNGTTTDEAIVDIYAMNDVDNGAEHHVRWNLDHLVTQEATIFSTVQAEFEMAQEQLAKEAEEAQAALRLASRKREERQNRRKEAALKRKQETSARRLQSRFRGYRQRRRYLEEMLLPFQREREEERRRQEYLLQQREKQMQEALRLLNMQREREEVAVRLEEEREREEQQLFLQREQEERDRIVREAQEKIDREREVARRLEEEQRRRSEEEQQALQRKESEEKLRRKQEEEARARALIEDYWFKLVQSAQRMADAVPVFDSSNQEQAGRVLSKSAAVVESSRSSADISRGVEDPVVLGLVQWKEFICKLGRSHQPPKPLITLPTVTAAITTTFSRTTHMASSTPDFVCDSPEQATSLSLCVEGLSSLSFLKKYSNLRYLQLNVNRLSHLDDLAHLTTLQELSVTDNILTSIRGLQNLGELRHLKMNVNQLRDLSSLEKLPSLLSVSLNSNRIERFPTFMQGNRIQKLEIYHNALSTVEDSALHSLTSLTHLDLGRNKLATIDGNSLSSCQFLTHLILSQNRLEDVPSPLYFPFLRVLWLSGNKILSLGGWCLERRPSSKAISFENATRPSDWKVEGNTIVKLFCPLLEKLYLQDNCIPSVPENVFVSAPALTELDISFNRISEIPDMIGLQQCRQLSKIQVQDNPVHGNRHHITWLLKHVPSLRDISGATLESIQREHTGNNGDNAAESVFRIFQRLGAHFHSQHDLLETDVKRSEFTISKSGWEALHLLNSMASEQNYSRLRIREFEKEKEQGDNNKVGLLGAHSAFELRQRHYDSAFVEVLSKHFEELKEFDLRIHSVPFVVDGDHSGCTLKKPSLRTTRYYQPKDYEDDSGANDNRPATPDLSLKQAESNSRHVQMEKATAASGTTNILSSRSSGQLSFLSSGVTYSAAIKLQARFRGIHVRKQLKAALDSAKYVDDELEEILGNDDFNMAKEFGDDYFKFDDQIAELSTSWIATRQGSNALVYGDHKRRRESRENVDTGNIAIDSHYSLACGRQTYNPSASVLSTSSSDQKLSLHRLSTPDSESMTEYGSSRGSHRTESAGSQFNGMTANTTYSRHARDSALHSPPESSSSCSASDIGSEPQRKPTINRQAEESKLAAEWGITDPSVIAVMLKRNRRLKEFKDAKVKQELDKDPEVRFQKFVRQVEGNNSNSTKKQQCAESYGQTRHQSVQISGSFGGKPRVVRGGRGGGRAGTGRIIVPTAWITDSES